MKSSVLLKSSAVLWIVWGLVHVAFGVMIISGDTGSGIQAIGDGVELAKINYPDVLGAIMNQHGWNLIWFGVATSVGAIFIWKGSITAIWVSAMVGGLADLGYFIFLDLGGYVNFVPGTVMTIISLSAILLSAGTYFKNRSS
ncbi:MAG TPA: hypothetical protein VKA23_03300 [Mariprofundaceae bacterium]|nr:hypothetical protein [Mariprofundaceae bacterium]